MSFQTFKCARAFFIRCLLLHSVAGYAEQIYQCNHHLQTASIQIAAKTMDARYKQFAQEQHLPGYIFGIMLDGRLIHTGHYGYADVKNKIPVNANTYFRIASMTKSFTAMAIMQLRDGGKLKLDDPIAHYLPATKNLKLTQDSPDIAIRDLLTHSAGFPEDNSWGDRQLDLTQDALLNLLKRGVSLSTPAASDFEYSNLGFALLGLVVDKVSGVSLQKFVAKNIWQPLKMHDAAWEYQEIPQGLLAHGYRWGHGTWEEEPLLHDGSFAAMGGMWISLPAFSRYVALHQAAWPPRDEDDSSPLKRASLREMHQAWRPYVLSNHPVTPCALNYSYGYGLRRTENCKKQVIIGHSGGLPGFGSNWLFLPEYGLAVILFTNQTYAPAEKINREVLDELIEQAHLKPCTLLVSSILQQRQHELMHILPQWNISQSHNIFASNFFKDNPRIGWKKRSLELFEKLGGIRKVTPLVPQTQLSGSFIIEGVSESRLKITLALSPDKPALIQSLQMEEIAPMKKEIDWA